MGRMYYITLGKGNSTVLPLSRNEHDLHKILLPFFSETAILLVRARNSSRVETSSLKEASHSHARGHLFIGAILDTLALLLVILALVLVPFSEFEATSQSSQKPDHAIMKTEANSGVSYCIQLTKKR